MASAWQRAQALHQGELPLSELYRLLHEPLSYFMTPVQRVFRGRDPAGAMSAENRRALGEQLLRGAVAQLLRSVNWDTGGLLGARGSLGSLGSRKQQVAARLEKAEPHT
jgi:hypothetical protein